MSADEKHENESNSSTDSSIVLISEWPIFSENRDVIKRKGFELSEEENDNGLSLTNSDERVVRKKPKICTHSSYEKIAEKRVSKPNHDFEKEPQITAKIARWWRQKRAQGFRPAFDVSKCSPDSMLLHISRLPECRTFLHKERKRLLCLLEIHGKKADLCAALANLDDYIGNFSSAFNFITKAVQLAPDIAEYLWLKEKISRQCQMLKKQNDAKKNIENDGVNLKFPCIVEVPRVSSENLSVTDFVEKYLKPGKPVIIRDVVSQMTSVPFDFSLIIKYAGSTSITTKEAVCDSVTWAKLENKRETTLAELISGIQKGSVNDFLFDWSLPLHCPSLAQQISLPSYFKDNYLLQTAPGSLYKDSWPSLFIAPKGATTELHIDAFHSHFWMALFQGEKRWTFFDPRDTALLYPQWFQSLDPVFLVDLGKPDLEKFPLLALTQPQQCVLRPGELLFVPAGSPHYVENLTPTLAISSNYVDHTNFEKVCNELRINALQDQRASDLLKQLQDSTFLTNLKDS